MCFVNKIIVGDKMFFKVNLSYDSLEPVINDQNLSIHYNKHYEKYVSNLNELLPNYNKDVVDVLQNIDSFDKKIRAQILLNAGGTYNHELYFLSMNNKPYTTNNLVKSIIKQYGSYEKFKEEFIKSANKLVGSGYTFLVLKNNALDIVNLPNQENPYTYNMIPLLALDLWEHAYYLTYFNDRNAYINNFFQIINYDNANKIYEEAKLEKGIR